MEAKGNSRTLKVRAAGGDQVGLASQTQISGCEPQMYPADADTTLSADALSSEG